MRGAPHVEFSLAMRRISSRRPALMEGRPVRWRRESQVQYLRNPARCHWITVSGFTKTSTSDHLVHILRNATQNSRSAPVKHPRRPVWARDGELLSKSQVLDHEIGSRVKRSAEASEESQNEAEHEADQNHRSPRNV